MWLGDTRRRIRMLVTGKHQIGPVVRRPEARVVFQIERPDGGAPQHDSRHHFLRWTQKQPHPE